MSTCAQVCLCVCVSVQVAVVGVGLRPTLATFFLQSHPLCVFETGSLTGTWNLELVKQARLGGQQVPGICLSLPLECWDYTDMPWLFMRALKIELRSLWLCGQHFTKWMVFPVPLISTECFAAAPLIYITSLMITVSVRSQCHYWL